MVFNLSDVFTQAVALLGLFAPVIAITAGIGIALHMLVTDPPIDVGPRIQSEPNRPWADIGVDVEVPAWPENDDERVPAIAERGATCTKCGAPNMRAYGPCLYCGQPLNVN